MKLSGGSTLYGLALGVLMLDTRFPRALGDVGNAATWPFPVSYHVVDGAIPERIAQAEPDPELLGPFIDGVRRLERDGVRAIVTSCGFLAAFQEELASAASVPVFTSALLQVPIAARCIGPDQKVGVLTSRAVLTERHFRGAGCTLADGSIVQLATPEDSEFVKTFVGNRPFVDTADIDREVRDLSQRLVDEHPDVGAVVMECTNFVPFSQTVRRVTGLPVFDFYTLGMHAYLASTGPVFDRLQDRPE
jgi:Asp/Glu/hydantoin racemase